jgi:subtilase family serine protease
MTLVHREHLRAPVVLTKGENVHGFRVRGVTARRLALVAVLSIVAVLVAMSLGSAHRSAAARMVPDTLRGPGLHRSIAMVPHPTATVQFPCQLALNDPGRGGDPTVCYGPDQLRAAYGVDQLNPNNGSGKTIVIVDAFGSSSIQQDLTEYDAVWGLSDPNFQVVSPYGNDSPTSDPNDVAGWGLETSLDVEWAHSIAQGANIVLVVAKSDQDTDILAATKYAIDNNLGDVISQSFGEAEQCVDPSLLSQEHAAFRKAVQKGITLFASSGDFGAGDPACDADPTVFPPPLIKAVSSPSSDPNVTAVGGTTLIADPPTGAYQSESTWNETPQLGPEAAGGGGKSVKYHEPLYQILAQRSGVREVPDVAYNAAVLHGVIVDDSNLDPTSGNFWLVGGTSAGSPQWAAITSIVDQIAKRRSGNINPALYALSLLPSKLNPFHDIADGSNNTVPDDMGGTIQGYSATKGYDMATGLGSPNIGAIAKLLAQQPASTAPTD